MGYSPNSYSSTVVSSPLLLALSCPTLSNYQHLRHVTRSSIDAIILGECVCVCVCACERSNVSFMYMSTAFYKLLVCVLCLYNH